MNFAALGAFVLPVFGLSGRAPVGIANVGASCFVNAVVQLLHKCPPIVEEVYQAALKPEASELVRHLAQAFGRMTEFTIPVNLEWDFYETFLRVGDPMVARRQAGG